MRVASSFSREFLEGFVERCQQMGLDCDQTESLFQKHANNTIIAEPGIYDGFREVLGHYEGPLPKSAMARWLIPDIIALAEDCRIKWGSDILSCQMRDAMGLPAPSWDTVPTSIKQAATDLSSSMDSFDHLPLNQKILLAALLGGGAGGAVRALAPTNEDVDMGRGMANRVTRGVGRGALAGAGAGVGAGAGSEVSDALSGPVAHGESSPAKLPAMLLGGALGGMGGFKLGE
jgi:hypothetical protein